MNNLEHELKQLIIKETNKDHLSPEDWADDAIMFGEESPIALDSIDALQISLAIQARYGVRLSGDRQIRKHMGRICDLAAFIRKHQDQ